MPVEVKLTGETWEHIEALLGNRAAPADEPADFQTMVAAFGTRCEAEGYDFEIWKKGETKGEKPEKVEKPTAAEAKRDEARAKLRDDLKGSLVETETRVVETPKKSAKKNGAEDPDARKARVILRLHELFDKNKTAIMKILADHGGGAKNFNAVPPESFDGISKALAELEATL